MITVRPAEPDDRLAVLRLVEGALLDIEPSQVESAITADRVLVAEDPIAGALVAEPRQATTRITAIAVTPDRRRDGIGTALVEEAAHRWGALTAVFDDRARPFYATLGFTITAAEGRWRGRYHPE